MVLHLIIYRAQIRRIQRLRGAWGQNKVYTVYSRLALFLGDTSPVEIGEEFLGTLGDAHILVDELLTRETTAVRVGFRATA